MIAKIAVSAATFAIDKPYSYAVPETMVLQPGILKIIHDDDLVLIGQSIRLHFRNGLTGAGDQIQRGLVDPGRHEADGFHLLVRQCAVLYVIQRDTGGSRDQTVGQLFPAGLVGIEPNPIAADTSPVQGSLHSEGRLAGAWPPAQQTEVTRLHFDSGIQL